MGPQSGLPLLLLLLMATAHQGSHGLLLLLLLLRLHIFIWCRSRHHSQLGWLDNVVLDEPS
jgi:hypothetical protein